MLVVQNLMIKKLSRIVRKQVFSHWEKYIPYSLLIGFSHDAKQFNNRTNDTPREAVDCKIDRSRWVTFHTVITSQTTAATRLTLKGPFKGSDLSF